MKKILFAILMMTGITSFAQQAKPSFDIMRDQTNSFLYKGKFTFEDLNKEDTYNWFKLGVKEYEPDAAAVAYLRQYLPDYDVIMVVGTWCDDSKKMIPMLYRVLDAANYPKDKYAMYGVDREKKGKNGEEQTYNVTMVPTVILSLNGKEQGRIVENAGTSVEADMVKIIQDAKGRK